MTTCTERDLIDAHFGGDVTVSDERCMRAHITDCAFCKAHYRKRQIFASLDPEAPSLEERLARGLGLANRERKRGLDKLPLPALTSILAVAAVLFFVVRSPNDDGFRSRGSVAMADTSTISVYRVSDRTLLSATNTLNQDDELAFSYDNASRKPYLMIFGVDEDGRVYWFYPAWTDESENPMAVKTDPGRVLEQLPEAIKHPFAGSHLTVHGLFLDNPLTVRDVEAALRDKRLDRTRAAVGGIDQTTTFEVIR